MFQTNPTDENNGVILKTFDDVNSIGDFQNVENVEDNTRIQVGRCKEDNFANYSSRMNTRWISDKNTRSALGDGKRKGIESDSIDNLDYMDHERQQKYIKQRHGMEFSQNKVKSEENTDVVRGTTYLLLLDDLSIDVSFKKVQLSSVRISTTKYTTLSAIQTLQFQKTQKNMRGHACMINHNGKWKLFFVWNSSLIHHGHIIGYMYDGHRFESKNSVNLTLSKKDKDFYWVRLNENQFPSNIFLGLKYPVIQEKGFYYGNHTPTMITLPKPEFSIFRSSRKSERRHFQNY